MLPKKIIFFLSHGINTDEEWITSAISVFKREAEMYYKELTDAGLLKLYFWDGSYGKVSWWVNILKPFRMLTIRNMKKGFNLLAQNIGYDAEVVMVSYSWSTYLFSELCKQVKLPLKIRNWILFGGVVHCSYPFHLIKTLPQTTYNFCSVNDKVASRVPPWVGYGHCGAYGFRINGHGEADSKMLGKEQAWKYPKVYNLHYDDNPMEDKSHYNRYVDHSGDKGWFDGTSLVKHTFKLIDLMKD